jgi:hypothetical protein
MAQKKQKHQPKKDKKQNFKTKKQTQLKKLTT